MQPDKLRKHPPRIVGKPVNHDTVAKPLNDSRESDEQQHCSSPDSAGSHDTSTNSPSDLVLTIDDFVRNNEMQAYELKKQAMCDLSNALMYTSRIKYIFVRIHDALEKEINTLGNQIKRSIEHRDGLAWQDTDLNEEIEQNQEMVLNHTKKLGNMIRIRDEIIGEISEAQSDSVRATTIFHPIISAHKALRMFVVQVAEHTHARLHLLEYLNNDNFMQCGEQPDSKSESNAKPSRISPQEVDAQQNLIEYKEKMMQFIMNPDPGMLLV